MDDAACRAPRGGPEGDEGSAGRSGEGEVGVERVGVADATEELDGQRDMYGG